MDPDPLPQHPPSLADQALIRAARVWGRDIGPGFWRRFRPERHAVLRLLFESGLADDPRSALNQLQREQAAQARPDLARVHVSWWVRALREEPRSVRSTVVTHLPGGLADALRVELRLGPDDHGADRPAAPVALRAVLALWSERLIGDLPERDDDPPVIVALTRFDAPLVLRLVRALGLAKWGLHGSSHAELSPDDLPRLERLQGLLGDVEIHFAQIVARDIEAIGQDDTRAEARARLGLSTVARLLAPADPYRVRWALQHLPYGTAKVIRAGMAPAGGLASARMLARWENGILRAAWSLLHAEGWINEPWRWGDRP